MSVYADLDGKCKRGLVVEYEGRILFVGNGTARMSRRDLFNASAVSRLKFNFVLCMYFEFFKE